MAITLSEIRVGFHGEGAGAGELTWGQMQIWLNTQRHDGSMNIAWTAPLPFGTLPEGASLADAAEMLRFMVSRHPALRTQLRFADGLRHPRQVVAASGEVPLHVADIGDDDDPAAAAEELRSRWEVAWFDYENEFPVRMGVIRQSGALVHLVFCYSHVMVDGAGLEVLYRDLEHRDLEHRDLEPLGQADGDAAGRPSQLELARWQGSAAGQRQSERAIRYWTAQLERLPAWRPREPGRQDGPPIAELLAYSPAMELGMRAVAAKTGADAASVLLAAYSVGVARAFGRDPSVALLVASNRFRPGLAGVVSQVAQQGIYVVDVADAAFAEVVARAQKAAANASFYAYYDPMACERLLDETAARRGSPLDIHWYVNDLRGMAGPAGGDGGVPTEAELTRALPHTRLHWNRGTPRAHGTLYLFVDSRPERLGVQAPADGAPAVYLKVWADARHFALGQVEALVREMEAVVVAAALDTRAVASRG